MVSGTCDIRRLNRTAAGLRRIVMCAAISVALVLSPGARAASDEQQQGSVSPVASMPSAPSQEPPSFADKATGDWGGLRRRLEEAGISLGFDTILEGFKNFRGGLNTHDAVGAPTLDLSLTLDAQKPFNWRGAKFYVDMEYHGGQDPTEVLVGDLQVFDKLNAPIYFQFFEMWYEQRLFDDKLRLKVGKVDANTEFSVVDNGLPFLNSSCQVSPTVFLLPTTPDPMPGINVFFTPNELYYAAFGAYYSNRSVRLGNLVGNPQYAQNSKYGAFLIGETGLTWTRDPLVQLDGNLRLGAWAHTGTFQRLQGYKQPTTSMPAADGTGQSASAAHSSTGSKQEGAYGYYIVLDQTLWQPLDAKQGGPGVRCFLEYGSTQNTVNKIDQHAGGGITWTGLLPGRPDDIVGFASQYAHISPRAGLPHSYEMAFETFYRVQLTPWATLQPDLQYIINPGGQYPNAVVGTLRLEMHF